MSWAVKMWKYLFNIKDEELTQPEIIGTSTSDEPIKKNVLWHYVGKRVVVSVDDSVIEGILYSVSQDSWNGTFKIEIQSPSFGITLDANHMMLDVYEA